MCELALMCYRRLMFRGNGGNVMIMETNRKPVLSSSVRVLQNTGLLRNALSPGRYRGDIVGMDRVTGCGTLTPMKDGRCVIEKPVSMSAFVVVGGDGRVPLGDVVIDCGAVRYEFGNAVATYRDDGQSNAYDAAVIVDGAQGGTRREVYYGNAVLSVTRISVREVFHRMIVDVGMIGVSGDLAEFADLSGVLRREE